MGGDTFLKKQGTGGRLRSAGEDIRAVVPPMRITPAGINCPTPLLPALKIK
jgi:hypothetical protein